MATTVSKHFSKVPLSVFAFVAWLVFANRTPNHDVAWFLEGIYRWKSGAKLYVDIREINPPLIFYETYFLTAGSGKYSLYVAGIVVATLVSSLWVGRHYGGLMSLAVFFCYICGVIRVW